MTDRTFFLSYSRKDSQIAKKLANDLRNAGVSIWLDKLHIPMGAIWDLKVEKALKSCAGLFFLASETSIESTNVLNEVYYALDSKKEILPIKIDGCVLPFRLARLQFVDLSNNYEQGIQIIIDTIISKKIDPIEGEEVYGSKTIEDNTLSAHENYNFYFPNGMRVGQPTQEISEPRFRQKRVKLKNIFLITAVTVCFSLLMIIYVYKENKDTTPSRPAKNQKQNDFINSGVKAKDSNLVMPPKLQKKEKNLSLGKQKTVDSIISSSVAGKIFFDSTGKALPIVGAIVYFDNQQTSTDNNGEFKLNTTHISEENFILKARFGNLTGAKFVGKNQQDVNLKLQ